MFAASAGTVPETRRCVADLGDLHCACIEAANTILTEGVDEAAHTARIQIRERLHLDFDSVERLADVDTGDAG